MSNRYYARSEARFLVGWMGWTGGACVSDGRRTSDDITESGKKKGTENGTENNTENDTENGTENGTEFGEPNSRARFWKWPGKWWPRGLEKGVKQGGSKGGKEGGKEGGQRGGVKLVGQFGVGQFGGFKERFHTWRYQLGARIILGKVVSAKV